MHVRIPLCRFSAAGHNARRMQDLIPIRGVKPYQKEEEGDQEEDQEEEPEEEEEEPGELMKGEDPF